MKDNITIAKQKLQRGLKMLSLDGYLKEAMVDQYLRYLMTLQQWNNTYNLTDIKTLNNMVVLHLLDSLSVVPYLKKTRYLDMGTGAGLPGLALAILLPEKEFVLLESNGKKTAFLHHIQQQLQLQNIEVVNSRAEHYHPTSLFDSVLSRALGSLTLLHTLGMPFLKPGGTILAMKGRVVREEINALSPDVAIEVIPLVVPFLDAMRHLIVLS